MATAAEVRAEAARAVVATAVAMEGAIKVEVVRVAVGCMSAGGPVLSLLPHPRIIAMIRVNAPKE